MSFWSLTTRHKPHRPRLSAPIQIIRRRFPQLEGYKCDGDLSVNRQAFQEATFYSGTWVFTATIEHGIERFPHDLTLDLLVRHTESKFEPVTSPQDVIQV